MAMGIRKVSGDSDNVYDTEWYKESVVKSERGNREHIAKFDRSFNGIMAKANAKSRDLADGDEIDRDDGVGASDHHASTVATLLVEAGSFPHRAAALQHLLHKPSGQALLARMHKTGKELPMDKTETLRAIAKAGGIVAVAKAIIDENRSYGITEQEFVELASESAQAEFPLLSKAQAFAKLYESEVTLREACSVLKAMPFQVDLQPLMVGGEAAQDVNDPTEAIEQLKQLGRDKWPTATEAQQFERALTAPENHALARRAVPRPQPTTSFPFPR